MTNTNETANVHTSDVADLTTLGHGLSGKVTLVHKQGEEGALEIDSVSGLVIPGQWNRPEWAASLVCASLAERHNFYTTRLGSDYADAHRWPEVFAYEDLSWSAVDVDTGEAVDIEASTEFRMEVLAGVVGMDLSTGEVSGASAEAEIAMDQWRSAEEIKALDETQNEGFKDGTAHG